MKRLLLVIVMALIAASCGGDGGIEIDDPWARSSARMQNAGAVYMTITADDGDTLTGVAVDSSVAMMAELHETQMSDEGTMAMQEVPNMAVPADGELNLEPGGFHIMLMQLAEPLESGDTFPVTLTFENAGEVVVDVEVREE
ncbi:MAG: copper chaperone PCu(A)C [Acidimicrobiia bacterium]|nr:copper chaperone PCu(A)C [Acidimicrobiia bacterium]